MASNPKYHDPANWELLLSPSEPNFWCEWNPCSQRRETAPMYRYRFYLADPDSGRKGPVFLCNKHLPEWCPILKPKKRYVPPELEAMRELLQVLGANHV